MKLPAGWTLKTLGEISEKPQYGWTTSADRSGKGLKFLRTTDISDGRIDWSTVPYCREEPPSYGQYRLRGGDILISRAGSVGLSALITEPPDAVFASYLIRFRPRADIDVRYVGYCKVLTIGVRSQPAPPVSRFRM